MRSRRYPSSKSPTRKPLKQPLVFPQHLDPSCVLALLPHRDNKWVDNSGKGNHGSLDGALFKPNGRFNPAMFFDGSNDNVDCGTDDTLEIFDTISVLLWAYPTASAAWQSLVVKSFRDPLSIMSHSLKFVIGLTWSDLSSAYFDTDLFLVLNEWNHIAFTYNSSTGAAIAVLNDVSNSAAYPALSLKDSGNVYPTDIGGGTLAGRYFSGFIDEVHIFNRVLSLLEIRNIFEAGRLN